MLHAVIENESISAVNYIHCCAEMFHVSYFMYLYVPF